MEATTDDRPLSELSPEAISDRLDALEDEADTLHTRPSDLDGSPVHGGTEQRQINRERMRLLDELIRRGLF